MAETETPEVQNTQKFLLEEYRLEVKAELKRWEKIEEKANRVFSFSTSVTAVLVGLFTLGESMMGQGLPLSHLVPFLWAYTGGVLIFAFSAVLALGAQSISRYKHPYLAHEQSMVREYLKYPVEDIQEVLIKRCVETLASLDETLEWKAKIVLYAQFLVIIAVGVVVLSMFVVIGALLGWAVIGG